jgi:nucleotide-binding universal stress UspA family protein
MSSEKILVPVDGSELSERAVPYAVALARATESAIVLLGVREGIDEDAALQPDLSKRIQLAEEDHQRRYLHALAERLAKEGLSAETESVSGDPSDAIVRAIEKLDPRLLVLATHGRSGLSRWHYGSVAGRLIREAPVPTLVIGPKVLEEEAAVPELKRILVPLDGSPLSEEALGVASQLAMTLGATIVLTRVVSWPAQPYLAEVPGFDVARLDSEIQEAAKEYLEHVRERLGGDLSVEASVLRGNPAEALMNSVRDQKTDLVVMATHSRAGLARAVLGSVADRMLQAAAPVLFVRPEGVGSIDRRERGRYCHNCGRASAYAQIFEEDRCLRCGQLLHACGNCVYHDGVTCMLQRPEACEVYPGKTCAYFQFRETERAGAKRMVLA